MIKTINATKLRNHFKESMDYVGSSKQPLVITERAVPTAVLIDIDEFEDMLSSKDKKFLMSIKVARKEYAKGEVIDMHELFEDII
jgi:prevent-host-death family protein